MTIIQGLKGQFYHSTGMIVIGVVFCVFEIIALTHGPAKIHSSVSD